LPGTQARPLLLCFARATAVAGVAAWHRGGGGVLAGRGLPAARRGPPAAQAARRGRSPRRRARARAQRGSRRRRGWAAAARGRSGPAGGGGGVKRWAHNLWGPAAAGRAAAARRARAGRPTTCARGAPSARGGAKANRRRQRRIWAGKRSGRSRVVRGSSPRLDFGRRTAVGGSSTERRSSEEERRWRARSGARFRPGLGAADLGEGWRRSKAKLGRLGCVESGCGGEGWPARRATASSPSSARREREGEEGWKGGDASRARERIRAALRRRSRGAMVDAWTSCQRQSWYGRRGATVPNRGAQ